MYNVWHVAQPRVGTESSQISDEAADFVVSQGIDERRHLPIEGASWTAEMDRGGPIGVRFGRREPTICEIGKRNVESDLTL